MTKLLLLLVLLQSVLPSHTHGPHANEEGARCYRGPTESRSEGRTFYHCECKLLCEGQDRREAEECVTSCGHDQCLCHADEPCGMDIEPSR